MNDSFTVTPMSNAIELKPGETYEGDILVSVPEASTSDFNYKVEVKPYGVIGNDYNADFISSSKNTDMVNWIKVANPTGTIAPNGKTHIKYTITVPSDAAGGGQYAALLIGKNDGESFSEGFGVQNVYSMASLIFAQIDGEIIHEGEVLENFVPGFVTGFPATASVMIKNDGNVHEPANVYLKIKNVFNGETVYPKEGDSGGVNEEIMPGTTRYLTKNIQDISPLGIYEVTQTIDYLGNRHITTQTMIACPVWFMFLLFVTICSIITFIISRVLKRKKTKE